MKDSKIVEMVVELLFGMRFPSVQVGCFVICFFLAVPFFVVAVIEHVRDGCTVRAFLLPSFHHVTVMLSGIKVCRLRVN